MERPDVVGYVASRARVFAPSEVIETAPEPDIAIYVEEPVNDWLEAEPFIVGEVMRGDSVDKDLFRNVSLYWNVPTIQEYWIFDIRKEPRRPSLLVHRRTRKDWEALEFAADAIYETPHLPGLKLQIAPPVPAPSKKKRSKS